MSKIIIFSFLIAFSSMLIVSCPDNISDNDPPLSPGMGGFKISLSSARTIIPTTGYALSDFSSFSLSFVAGSNGTSKTAAFNASDLTGINLPIVELEPGDYSLTVTALKGTTPAARGTAASINIIAGSSNTVPVLLKALLDEPGGIGTFAWNVTLPAGVNNSTMTIRNSSNVVQGAVVSLNAGNNNGLRDNLANGQYTVVFYIEKTVANETKVIEWNEMLHVYSTLTSSFLKQFYDSDFSNQSYVVTKYKLNGDVESTQSVNHGAAIPNAFLNPPAAPHTVSLYQSSAAITNPGWNWSRWYDYSTGATVNTGTAINKNISIYPEWASGPLYLTGNGNDYEKAIAYVNNNPDTYYLYLSSDVTTNVTQKLENSNINLIIQGIGSTRTITLNRNGTKFAVEDGAKLTIGNFITLQGRDNNSGSVVTIHDNNSTFTMQTGSRITGNNYMIGSGVFVGYQGIFIMNGGTINNNTASFFGGGVFVAPGGTFTMNSGSSITVNTANMNGGGVYVSAGVTPTINGSVTSNTAPTGDPDIYYQP